MKQYTVGEFAKKAGISTYALRHYDKMNLMKPSAITETGYRLYTDADLNTIRKIIALRWLELSLTDIKKVLETERADEIQAALQRQKESFMAETERLQQIIRAIEKLEKQNGFQWNQLIDLMRTVRIQNIYADYQLHAYRAKLHKCSTNKERWHTFLFHQMKIRSGQRNLEIDARDGQLWIDNSANLPACHLTQSVSKQIYATRIRAAMDETEWRYPSSFHFAIVPLDTFWLPERSYDIIVANHLYIRIEELDTVLQACARALKPGGRLFCAAIGENHMKEVLDIAKEYDASICFDRMDTLTQFSMNNGMERLKPYFRHVEWNMHPDVIRTSNPELIVNYLWCNYSNMRTVLKDKREDFLCFIRKRIAEKGQLIIHKEHGVFCASSPIW